MCYLCAATFLCNGAFLYVPNSFLLISNKFCNGGVYVKLLFFQLPAPLQAMHKNEDEKIGTIQNMHWYLYELLLALLLSCNA
jgi:hypothetical protein